MSWMVYTEFFYPGCNSQPGYYYLSMSELYDIPEDEACIGTAGIDAYFTLEGRPCRIVQRCLKSEKPGSHVM